MLVNILAGRQPKQIAEKPPQPHIGVKDCLDWKNSAAKNWLIVTPDVTLAELEKSLEQQPHIKLICVRNFQKIIGLIALSEVYNHLLNFVAPPKVLNWLFNQNNFHSYFECVN